jgi:hypothetical protein
MLEYATDDERLETRTRQFKAIALVCIVATPGFTVALQSYGTVVAYGLMFTLLLTAALVGGFASGIEYATDTDVRSKV